MIRNLLYCDASLTGEGGHFAGLCRNVTRELRARGISCIVLANREIRPELAAELGAQPFFQAHTWANFSDDPLCGWLVNFERRWQAALADLGRLGGVSKDDVVHYECGVPSQILALIRWAERFPSPADCPRIVVTLTEHSGALARRREDGSVEWVLGDPQTQLYRYAGLALRPPLADRFRFVAFHQASAALYASLLGHPAQVLPLPLDACTASRQRGAAGTLTVGFLGAQRENKGFHLVPEICERLLQAHPNVKILVQNSWGHMQAQMQALNGLAGREPRLRVLWADLAGKQWAELLESVDVVATPYDQAVYASALSGVSMEALMNAIPQAVPRHTAIEAMMLDYGMPGVAFERSEPGPVVDAIGELLRDFAPHAGRALEASRQWRLRNGAAKFMDEYLRMLDAVPA